MRSLSIRRGRRPELFGVLLLLVAFAPFATASASEVGPPECTITGTPGNDVLVGTPGDDVICAGGGDDVLLGGDGDDVLRGQDGDDVLVGGPGTDRLVGGRGADELRGGDDTDTLVGKKGRDRLIGGDGDDLLFGGPGRDRMTGGAGADLCADSGVGRVRECEPGARDLLNARALFDDSGIVEYVYEIEVDTCIDEPPGIAPDVAAGDPVVDPAELDLADRDFADADPEAADEVPDMAGINAETRCVFGFGQFVRVDADGVHSDTEVTMELDTEGLFALASETVAAGGSVTFDEIVGLPVEIASDERLVVIRNIEDRTAIRAAFEDAQSTWDELGALNYQFTVRRVCFCLRVDPIRVTVIDGDVIDAVSLEVREADQFDVIWTIDEHLEQLEAALDAANFSVRADFDAALGYPTSWGIDVHPLIADEEVSYLITDVEVTRTSAPVTDDEPVDDDLLTDLDIVSVDGIEVAASLAPDLAALLDAAAAGGFDLHGGGFRDPQRQIELRRANCGDSPEAIWEWPASSCSPPTARPGESQHELGLAVDFTSDGRLITSRNDPAFVWLADNAADYGLINLPSEPWHWSTTGN